MERTLVIPTRGVELEGDLAAPPGAIGIVVFAHGSGSGRRGPRNRFVAQALQARGVATLLLDLLTTEERRMDALDGHLRADVLLHATRLGAVTDWLRDYGITEGLPVGYFGAGTGAAAALIAAAERPHDVWAIVSRGGRPDLARAALGRLRTPTLLVVGGADDAVLSLSQEALSELRGPKRLVVVPGATHLFDEPGAIERVAAVTGDWFLTHLDVPPSAEPIAPHGTMPRHVMR